MLNVCHWRLAQGMNQLTCFFQTAIGDCKKLGASNSRNKSKYMKVMCYNISPVIKDK